MKSHLALASTIEDIKAAKRKRVTDDLNSDRQLRKNRKVRVFQREVKVWQALSDAKSMSTSSRAAEFNPPNIAELVAYITSKGLVKPRNITRESLFIYMRTQLRYYSSR